MSPTVDQPAAEREPELPCNNPSPHRGHRYVRLPGTWYICPGQVWTPSRDTNGPEREPDHVTPASICSNGWHVSRQQPTRPCPTCGDVADYAADQLLDHEREPDGLTPEQIALDREIEGLDDAGDVFVIGQTSAGWPGTDLAPVSEVIHFDAGRVDQYAACGYDLDRNGPEGWTTDRAKVTCSECAGKVVDEQLAEPERRTVSLEVLTDELRAVASKFYEADDEIHAAIARARAGVVFRVSGTLTAVPYVDTDWVARSGAEAFASLMKQAQSSADFEGAELLMPTPDVLAALDGRPDAQLLTAPVPVMHRDMQPGWFLISLAEPGDSIPAGTEHRELIEAVTACDPGVATFAHVPSQAADCTILTIGGLQVHFDSWLTNPVRIPCAVTR